MRSTKRPLQETATLGLSITDLLRGSKPDRMRQAESTGQLVIASLNAKPNAGTRRVEHLIKACHQISKLVGTLKRSSGPSSAQDAEVSKAVLELNIALGRYKWHPDVSGSMAAGSHFRVVFGIVGLAFDPELAMAHYAVQWIVEHVDDVQRVRRCQVQKCQKWFYAKKANQKYCGDKCRKKDASEGDAFKEQRRIYMKEYRREEAKRNARSKRIANQR